VQKVSVGLERKVVFGESKVVRFAESNKRERQRRQR
jgi:hypothetical protein